jgi:DNA-binding CsgD family transcriptional regulator
VDVLTSTHQEKLAGNILRASYEASTLNDLAEILPLFEKLFDTSLSILYQCNDRGELVGVGGALEAHQGYAEQYFSSDPMRHAIQRMNRKILHASRCPEWKEFLNLPAYHDHAKYYGVDDYLLLRLTEAVPFDLGMVGLLLARTRRHPDFSEHEGLLLARLLPALEALVRRSARVEQLLEGRSVMEGMMDSDPRPKIALDVRGSLLWTSERAEKLTGLRLGGRRPVPKALTQAARRLGALTCPSGRRAGKDAASAVPFPLVSISGQKTEPIRMELRLARTRSGEPFILAELEIPDISPRLAEAASRFHLTAAETHVLDLLAQGLSDQKIARRLFISLATVRTHVGSILSKLGVHSRVQAALLAHGLKLEEGSGEEMPPKKRVP